MDQSIQLNLIGKFIIFLSSLCISILTNFIKVYYPKLFKLAVVTGSFILTQIIVLSVGQYSSVNVIFYLFPMVLAVLAYGVTGGFIIFSLAILNYYLVFLLGPMSSFEIIHNIIVLGIINLVFCFLIAKTEEANNKNQDWLEKLHSKINELSLLKEIGNLMQTTTNLKKVNKIVLTAITAGYGLGFNRGLLFLVKEKDGKKVLQGEMAIGPLSQQEAYRIWGNVVRTQNSLSDVIAVEDEVDESLNDFIRKITLQLTDGNNPLIKSLLNREPIKKVKADPNLLGESLVALKFTDYAIVPLIAKKQAIGVILVDNKFNGKPITDEDMDSLITLVNQGALAIENIMLYEKFAGLAITDGLTGLYNHRFFKEQLTKLINEKQSFALLVIDIDDFKEFNEIYGHACGDSILSSVGESIKKVVGSKGIPCRYGGDEFTIILPNYSRIQGKELAVQIQEEVKKVSLNFNGVVQKPLTLSIGLALYPTDANTGEELFCHADSKLKISKISGKDTIT